jgi:hypothetical protein
MSYSWNSLVLRHPLHMKDIHIGKTKNDEVDYDRILSTRSKLTRYFGRNRCDNHHRNRLLIKITDT